MYAPTVSCGHLCLKFQVARPETRTAVSHKGTAGAHSCDGNEGENFLPDAA